MTEKKHNHYFKDVSHLQQVDVYRILELFEVTCPVAQHIVKKALAAGKRGAKSPARDMQDIADSANRWLAMREEDASPRPKTATELLMMQELAAERMCSWIKTTPFDPLDAAYSLTKGAA